MNKFILNAIKKFLKQENSEYLHINQIKIDHLNICDIRNGNKEENCFNLEKFIGKDSSIYCKYSKINSRNLNTKKFYSNHVKNY